jgi:hypothetical protein
MTAEQKATIDGMDRLAMASLWRFGEVGHWALQGECGAYFAARFKDLGGFSPEISKQIGWH